MSADTLTADGASVALAPPSSSGDAFTGVSYAVVSGLQELAVAWRDTATGAVSLSGYGLDGSALFDRPLDTGTGAPQLFTDGTNTQSFGAIWVTAVPPDPFGEDHLVNVGVFNASGVLTHQNAFPLFGPGPARAIGTDFGFHIDSISTPKGHYQETYGDRTPTNAQIGADQEASLATIPAYAEALIGSTQFAVHDNQAQLGTLNAITLPGEPARAVTEAAAASLAGGGAAAVAWADSGTGYVSIYNAAGNTFGAVAGLDWGGVNDLHVVGLPDGGFAVSWMNGGAYKGEVFDAAGSGGGVLSPAGDVTGVESNGDLYTVGLDANGHYVVQAYAIASGAPAGGGGGGGGGTAGQTFTSDNNGDVWTGTAGNDTFNLGRGGDWVTGNGGNDTFKFAGVPWAGGHITDFNAGDVLDLTGLMSTTSDTGTDGFADGYLMITDSAGGAQVWANYNIPGNDGWWLVETLNGVASTNLTHSGDVVSVGSSSGGGGGGTTGQTFTSDDNGDVWVGTAGDDVFHLGRGGDWVTGGAGADTFAYAAIPWAGGGITDFNGAEGDRIDINGLLANAGYSGSDPFADGYLKYTTDSSGNAQLWADYNVPGNDGWWLVATLDGVSTSSLHYASGLIT